MSPESVFYLIVLPAGVLLAGGLFCLAARREGLSVPRAAAGFLCGALLAFAFAKGLYVLLFGAALNEQGIGKWLRMAPEEFSFMAGAAGFCLGNLAAWARRPAAMRTAADCLAFPGCLLAALIRFGENFAGLLGAADLYSLGLAPEEGSLFARFPLAVRDAWGDWYPSAATLSALLLALIGVRSLLQKRRGVFPEDGLVFDQAAFLFCVVPFFPELVRVKSLVFWFVHVDQALCAAFMAALLLRLCCRRRAAGGRFPALPPVLLACCFAVNGITQYLMDKPWQLEGLLPEAAFQWFTGHLAVFGYSLLLATSVLPAFLMVRRRRGSA